MTSKNQVFFEKGNFMNRYNYFVLIFMCLLSLNGCGGMVMTAVSTVRGGESDLIVVERVQNLQSYNSINLNPFTISVYKRLTPKLLTYMNNKIHDQLSDNGAKLEEDGQLSVSGTVLHLADGFRIKQILVQVKLQDTTTDHLLGVVNVMGKASGLRGIKSAADAVAEGVTELLASYQYPGI